MGEKKSGLRSLVLSIYVKIGLCKGCTTNYTTMWVRFCHTTLDGQFGNLVDCYANQAVYYLQHYEKCCVIDGNAMTDRQLKVVFMLARMDYHSVLGCLIVSSDHGRGTRN